MKRSTFITLLCSFIAAIVAIIGIMLGLIATGVINVDSNTLVIVSGSAKAIYDGTELTDNEWYLSKGELKEGHTLEVSVSGKQLNVGQSENYVSAKVIDAGGADVSADYEIQYKPGILEVIARDICIIADSAKKLYDGEALTSDEYMLQLPRQLVDTDTLEVTIEGEQIEIGSSDNVITDVKIFNQFGEEVTRNYNIIEEKGILIVYDENALVIATDSDTKEYDGSKLINENWYLVEGELKTDHHLEVEVTGKQTGYGSSKNDFVAKIYDGEGNDVTNTYVIYKELGTLLVEKRTLTIISDSATQVFDTNKTLTSPRYTISPVEFTGLIKFGDGEVEITGSQHEVGSSNNTIVLSDDLRVYAVESGADITHNFNVVTEEGVLTVIAEGEALPEELVLESASVSKSFDGKDLKGELCRLTSGQLKTGHKLIIEYTGSQKYAGFSDNTFDVRIVDTRIPIDENGEIITERLIDTNDKTEYLDVTDRYFIKKRVGSLRVFPVEVVITSNDAQQVYNGEPLVTEATAFTVLTNSARGNYVFAANILGSRTNVGTGPNVITACTAYADVIDEETGTSDWKDIYQNFIFTRVSGNLTVVEDESMLKTEVQFNSGSPSKEYDGAPLSPSSAFLAPDSNPLPEGYTVEYIYDEDFAITDVGKSDNVFTVRIFNADGEDVTDKEFIVTYNYGILEIKKIKLIVATKSKTDVYSDTKSLVNHELDMAESDISGILDGDGINWDTSIFTGVQTLIGESKNTAFIDITCNTLRQDGTPFDFMDLYEIEYKYGKLKVSEDQLPDVVIKVREINNQFNRSNPGMNTGDYVNDFVSIEFKYEPGSEDEGRYEYRQVGFVASGDKTGYAPATTLTSPGTYKSYVDSFLIWDTKNAKLCAVYEYDRESKKGFVYPLDDDGNKVTSEDDNESGYLFPKKDPVQNEAILRYYRHKIKVVSGDSTDNVYNGVEHYKMDHRLAPGMNTLDSGHSVSFTEPKGCIDVGRYENSCVTTVRDGKGNNVTSEYWIVKDYGEIEVVPATLTLTAASKTVAFDSNNMVKIECPFLAGINGLVSGDTVELDEGAIRPAYALFLPGEVDNIIDTSLVTVTGVRGDVTKNYKIVVISGILRIE